MNQFVKSSGYIARMPIANTIYSLVGASVAANETGFDILGMNGISLDAGIANYNANHTFITHTHHDHTKALIGNILNLEATKKNKMNIYCPRGSHLFLREKLEKEYNSTKHNVKQTFPWRLIGVTSNETFDINCAGKTFRIDTVQCTHSIACTGYGFTEIRKKVTEEHLKAISLIESNEDKKKYFKNLQENNINYHENLEIPLFIYLGDTTHKVFDNEKILKYPTIIVECTFLDNETVKKASDDKHMHWNNLKPIVIKNSNNQFILNHFSARYSTTEIVDFFKNENLSNVFPFVSHAIDILEFTKNIHIDLCGCNDLVNCNIYQNIMKRYNLMKQ
jgi:ribonuclease BN (tRNA processing enzyme)